MVFLLVYTFQFINLCCSLSLSNLVRKYSKHNKINYDYDVIIIGAGASGLFASGTASSMFGYKTALISNINDGIGGDCTNAACVPSKALHSFANSVTTTTKSNRGQKEYDDDNYNNIFTQCQQYIEQTVNLVKKRENPDDMIERNTNLDIIQVNDCHFIDPHTLMITSGDTVQNITSSKFLIATGSAPIIPQNWKDTSNIYLSTYKSILSPYSNDPFWNNIAKYKESSNQNNNKSTIPNNVLFRIVIIGGGPTACELCQSIIRICNAASYNNTNDNNNINNQHLFEIHLIAPCLLPNDDITLQQAAYQILNNTATNLNNKNNNTSLTIHLQNRVESILSNNDVILLNNNITIQSVDAILVCIGRSPDNSLKSLKLSENANVEWISTSAKNSIVGGINVNPKTLQSTSAKHIYASGDCCLQAASSSRTATHAAWTGFHAIRNMKLPHWLLGFNSKQSKSIHSNVPRVIYTK